MDQTASRAVEKGESLVHDVKEDHWAVELCFVPQ